MTIPHNFNHLQNANYVGLYPSKKHYAYRTMSDTDQAKFVRWYESVAGQVFDFKKQHAVYFKNNVFLLPEGCIKYRKEFIECTNVDLFGFVRLRDVL